MAGSLVRKIGHGADHLLILRLADGEGVGSLECAELRLYCVSFSTRFYNPFNCHKVDCLGEETVLVPGFPGIWGSVVPTRWQKFKKGITWM